MITYFFDWEVMDEKGMLIKWSNSLSEASEDVTPTEVFNKSRDEIYKKLKLPENYHVRARSFNKI